MLFTSAGNRYTRRHHGSTRHTCGRKGSVLVADGAWGTEFFKRGLMQGSPPDEWNLTHPEIVREITREYLEAGADIVLTNTFGANRFRLEPHGLSDRVREINARGRGHRARGRRRAGRSWRGTSARARGSSPWAK